ncbi:MAG: DUF308 domain-containing protein [Saprospiraceae bacterium]|nr:DUF308 domain-containing protein [Saprospiraceae bacterium]MCC6411763.1 DUF308 domain-containing protein [Saprospiraceae bacterium]
MLKTMSRFWWMLILRGLVALLFAFFAFTRPEVTFTAMVVMLGAFFLADGLLALVLGWQMRGEDDEWWSVFLEGGLGVVLGLLALLRPDIGAATMVMFIALWCLLSGTFEFFAAIKLRKEIENEWMLGLAGLVSIALGVLMLINPTAGAISIVWWIGLYAAIFGVFFVLLGLRLRNVGNKIREKLGNG